MPSRFEPCGLGQLIAMKYGAIPVANYVGGLVDTIRPFDPTTGTGTGFLFKEYSAVTMTEVIKEAVRYFLKPSMWNKLVFNSMNTDFSWKHSAQEYIAIFTDIARHKGTAS